MIWLVLGLLLWTAAHFFQRLAPNVRARMGDAGKGLVAVLILVSVALMVIGYRGAEIEILWAFGGWAISVNNLLMVVAIVLVGVGSSKSRLRGKLRHPMLIGTMVWSVAHLLVNGDVASVALFGGIGLWAVLSIRVINKAEPVPEPYVDGSVQGDVKLLVISAVVFVVVVSIHTWLGYWPFPG